MDTSTVVLALRVALALGCVLGVLWWLGRRVARGGAQRRPAALTVVARQGLGQKAAVAVVDADGKRLLLGVSEHGVTLLAELDAPPAVEADASDESRVELDPADLADLVALPTAQGPAAPSTGVPVPPSTPAARMPAVPKPRHPLEGSILDAATWRQAVVAVQERTIRR